MADKKIPPQPGSPTTGPEFEDVAPEMGVNEAHASNLFSQTASWGANTKRTYDEYQQESLETIKRSRDYIGRVLANSETHDEQVRAVAMQALQNAVETSNLVGKQAVRHADISIDRTWNVDEVSTLTAKSGVEADAVIAALVAALAKSLNPEE